MHPIIVVITVQHRCLIAELFRKPQRVLFAVERNGFRICQKIGAEHLPGRLGKRYDVVSRRIGYAENGIAVTVLVGIHCYARIFERVACQRLV